jgi:hypothetical protein
MPARSAARSPALAAAIAFLAAGCASSRTAGPAASQGERLASGWTRQAFPLRAQGRVVLSLPPGWTATEGEEGEASSPAIRLEREGERFRALLTPLWNPGEREAAQARADTAQLFAELARRKALGGSVEHEIPLEELSGPGVKGFWFTATDRDLAARAPGPEEWRCILQGAAAIGPVLLAFTLLDDGPGPQRDEVLEVVRGARFVAGGGAPEDAAELEAMPGLRTVPLRVGWPGRTWAVLVDLPGFAVGARTGARERGPYFVGIQDATGIVASVALRAAGGATDAAGCLAAAVATVRRAFPAAAATIRTAEAEPAVRATYTIAEEETPQANAHAFLHRDGLCVDVHVSKLDPEPGDAERLEAILGTVRIAEDL